MSNPTTVQSIDTQITALQAQITGLNAIIQSFKTIQSNLAASPTPAVQQLAPQYTSLIATQQNTIQQVHAKIDALNQQKQALQGNSMSTWIYILIFIIVLLLIFLAIYYLFKGKKRVAPTSTVLKA